jgi:hypothetical protein
MHRFHAEKAYNAPREEMTEIINAYMAYGQDLRDAKVLVASKPAEADFGGDHGAHSRRQTKVLDEPFAETKEHSAAIT